MRGIDERAFWLFLAIVLAAGFALGWVFFDGLPMLWQWIKPWLLGVTT